MPEILLTFHCATRDAPAVTDAIRLISQAPVHLRQEEVRGWDFDDADTVERVSGHLRRTAIELIVEQGDLPQLLQSVTEAKRDRPVRWAVVPVLNKGRVA